MRNACLIFGADDNAANVDEKLSQSTEHAKQQDCMIAPQVGRDGEHFSTQLQSAAAAAQRRAPTQAAAEELVGHCFTRVQHSSNSKMLRGSGICLRSVVSLYAVDLLLSST